jgi:3-phenylpropionate/trans-cinnamate dioxygenase ferredoxin reductase subunit
MGRVGSGTPTAPASIVVVGAGLAGVGTCERLRALGYDGRLTLIGAEDQLPYDRPPLSKQFLVGDGNAEEIRLRPASWYADADVRLRLGTPVREIRVADGDVVPERGVPEPADVVVLATGGRARPLAVPGADHRAVTTLRTLRDSMFLRDRLAPGARVGVVGAGLIGAEVVASAVARGCAVTLVDPSALPLAGVVGPAVADILHDQHRRHGVRLIRAAVSAVHGNGDGARLLLDSGATVDCDVVVVGIGIEHDLGLASTAGLATDRGVLVDDHQRTSNPHVFALGDVARVAGPDGSRPRTGHWDAALRGSAVTASAVLGVPAPPRRAPWFWSDRYDTHVEVVGEFAATAGGVATVVRGTLADLSFVAFAVRDGRCVGAVSANRAREMAAVRRLVDRQELVDVTRLGDDSVDLREMVLR